MEHLEQDSIIKKGVFKKISQSVLLEIEILGWSTEVGKAKSRGQSQIM